MSPPTIVKQLKILQGKLQSIQRFIAQLVDKCNSFQYLLPKGVTFKWNDQCEIFPTIKILPTQSINSDASHSRQAIHFVHICY